MNKSSKENVPPLVHTLTSREQDSRYGYQGGSLGRIIIFMVIAMIIWASKVYVDTIMLLPAVGK